MVEHEAGRLVMVAEDQAIIGMFVAEILSDEGYRVAGPFRTCSEGSSWLQDHSPDLALLDVGLADGPCFDLARQLSARKVPFMIFSGTYPRALHLRELGHVEWIEKPGSVDQLVRALKRLSFQPLPRNVLEAS